MIPATILVVEDDERVRRLLVDVLVAEGYSVAQACNGRVALEMLEQGKVQPDLLLTDNLMPEMNGLVLCARLSLQPAWRKLPVVLLSAGRPPSAIPLPHAQFLAKPFALDVLLPLLARTLVLSVA